MQARRRSLSNEAVGQKISWLDGDSPLVHRVIKAVIQLQPGCVLLLFRHLPRLPFWAH